MKFAQKTLAPLQRIRPKFCRSFSCAYIIFTSVQHKAFGEDQLNRNGKETRMARKRAKTARALLQLAVCCRTIRNKVNLHGIRIFLFAVLSNVRRFFSNSFFLTTLPLSRERRIRQFPPLRRRRDRHHLLRVRNFENTATAAPSTERPIKHIWSVSI